MTEAIKIEWYDLPAADRPEYLDWLHDTYLPAQQAIQGHSWLGHYAINRGPDANSGEPRVNESPDPEAPRGLDYMLLTSAPSPDVFFDHNKSDPTGAGAGAQFAKRKLHSASVFLVETSVTGPEYRNRVHGSGPAPVIQVGNYQLRTPADDYDVGLWYRQYRLPQCTVTPGCIGAKKLISVAGWAKHAILYECIDCEPGQLTLSQFMQTPPQGDQGVWNGRPISEFVLHAPNSAIVGERIWPAR